MLMLIPILPPILIPIMLLRAETDRMFFQEYVDAHVTVKGLASLKLVSNRPALKLEANAREVWAKMVVMTTAEIIPVSYWLFSLIPASLPPPVSGSLW